jgi:hypothetical protein
MDYVAKAITEEGTVLIRTSIQEWLIWYDACKKAHLVCETRCDLNEQYVCIYVCVLQKPESVPLVVAKDPNKCAQAQARWCGRTSSCYFYVVAHNHSKKFYWDRTPSGFMLRNWWKPSCNIISGISPATKSQRLKKSTGQIFRLQVRSVGTQYFSYTNV